MKFNTTQGATSSSGDQMMNMTVDFAAGITRLGRLQNPESRPMLLGRPWIRNGEPTQIRLELVYFAQQQQARHGSPVDRSPTAAENYPDAQNVGTYTVQLIGAVCPVKR